MKAVTIKDLPLPTPEKFGWPWTKSSQRLPEKMADGSDWPRLSIITPSYNQGKFLEATIRSVLLQGYPNLEYIIIDGGSSDNSIEIIKKYEKFLVYWHSKPDQGQSDAINQGIEKSRGTILGWINSDDMYVKGAFHKVIKAFYTHPDSIVVHGNRILINEAGEVTGWSSTSHFDPRTRLYNIFSETAFWRYSAMQKTGVLNPDLQFAMDLEFFCRLYQHGNFLKLNDYLGYLRYYSSSKSSTISHIGEAEAKREWKRLFGSENINFEFKTKKNFWYKLKLVFELVSHPNSIFFPYLIYRLKKTKG